MKSKHLALLAVVLAVLALACVLLLQREHASWQSAPALAGSKALPAFDPGAVAEVRVASGGGTVTLARKNDAWTVAESGGYAANFDLVRSLVRRLWEMKAVQDVAAADGSQLAQLQLVEPVEGRADAGTLVELKDPSGKRLVALLAGKTFQQSASGPGGYPAGRYLMALDGKNRVVLVSDPLAELSQPAKDWLKRDFVHIGDPQSLAVKGPSGEWKLSRSAAADAWKLGGGKAPDTAKADAAVNAIRSPFFEDVAAANEKKFDYAQPDTVTVRTFDGFTYDWTIGKPQGDAYPVKLSVSADLPTHRPATAGEKPEDKEKLDKEFADRRATLEARLKDEKKFENWIFLIPKSSLTTLLVPRQSLLATATPSPTPAANR